MEERGLVGLKARTSDGEELGRISELVVDDASGAVTHVILERAEDLFEVPITAISLDRDVDYATFHADRSDEEPGDHAEDTIEPAGYAPQASNEEDYRHEGQLASAPQSEEEAQTPEDLVREDWENETHTPDSGYPRNDAYIDPETGEGGVESDIALLVDGTGLEVRSVTEGFVELGGSAPTPEELKAAVEDIMELYEVRGVDTADVDIG